MAAVLTKISVEAMKPDPDKRREVPDGALPGFYLVIQPTGKKSWAVRYRFGGKPKKHTIGAYPKLEIGKARELARAALQAVAEGRDPAAEKESARQTEEAKRNTFGTVAADYIKRVAKAHHRTWAETERLLTKKDLEAWQDKDIRSIGRREILEVLDAIVERKSPVQANRLLTRLKPFFAWAVERGIIDASPAEKLRPPSPETARDRVLTDAELVAVWKAAEETGYPFGSAMQLLILTGQRRSEVLEAEWREFDISQKTWTIPRERSKTDVAHVVPLSEPVIEILEALPKVAAPAEPGTKGKPEARLLFTTNGKTPFSGVTKVLDRLNAAAKKHMPDEKPLPSWRLHDLRRTFASGCARLGIPVHVIEKALNHTSGTFGGIVGVYQRHDFATERRDAMKAWAGYVTSLTKAKPKNVVALREVQNVG
ncbi:tyrosine-type recombinase/integrase [Microvirga flavescens]|uniref:tyrosine-type recombinase/integrase n=1 Tax=Microvirga flavescens TaxID=2249811 RepID=UPI0013009A1C|nr:site-specific integrase [Microvirga flavescens]